MEPTILATSGGVKSGLRTEWEFTPLFRHALALTGASQPKVCFLATAGGDDRGYIAKFYAAAVGAGIIPSHLSLFSLPNVDDIAGLLMDQDVIFVGGGSVAGLLAMWRLHGVDKAMEKAWQAGVVLTGISAGSLCWHVGGPTDSFGPKLEIITNGLGFLPYSNSVHYDSDSQRRSIFQAGIADGIIPDGYATDNGVGLLYRGTTFVEALTEIPGKRAYNVTRDNDSGGSGVTETLIEPTLLR